VPLEEIRSFLIELFQTWTMPKAIRTDNGLPFGIPCRDVVSIMSLWLKAWGIIPILNRPRRPTDNSKVERAQGTTSRWAEVKKCADLNALQQQLDEACLIQREKYPVLRLGKVTRANLYKSLYAKTRPFNQAIFDELRAYEHLSKLVMARKVGENGMVVIYDKPFSIGAAHKRKIVFIKLRSDEPQWTVLDERSNILKVLSDSRFDRDQLFNLTCQRTKIIC